MRIEVTIINRNEARVNVTPGWLFRYVLGESPREFYVQRAAAIDGGNRWYSPPERAYIKHKRILAALDRAWWVFDKAERQDAVKLTFGRRLEAERQRLRAELGLE